MFSGCGNDKAAQEAEAKRVADSIAAADEAARLAEEEAARLAEEEAAAAAENEKTGGSKATTSQSSKSPSDKTGTVTNSGATNSTKTISTKTPGGVTKQAEPSQTDKANNIVKTAPQTDVKQGSGKMTKPSGQIKQSPQD